MSLNVVKANSLMVCEKHVLLRRLLKRECCSSNNKRLQQMVTTNSDSFRHRYECRVNKHLNVRKLTRRISHNLTEDQNRRLLDWTRSMTEVIRVASI